MELTLEKNRIAPLLDRTRTGTLQGTDAAIVAAYQAACDAGRDYAQKALVCGHMLNEKRAEICAGDTMSPARRHNQHTPREQRFEVWMDQHFPEKTHRTLQRWMAAAERTAGVLHLDNCIDVEAQVLPLSQILTLPESELTERGREMRQLWLDFTADKTISECLRDVVDGESPDHRIARAANGKLKGGTNARDDRKAFEKFTTRALRNITSFLTVRKPVPGTGSTRFDRWRELAPAQEHSIGGSFSSAIEQWPRWLVEVLADKAREELRLSDEERHGRNSGGQ